MELMMIQCCVCEECFITKNETGEHKCPKCDAKNERYVFDENTTEEEIELICEIHKDIREVLNKHGMEAVSNIKIVDFLVK